ncbi:MAG: hypothetical protein ACOY3Y_18805 [Acidobacteriota bacterium]
MKSRRRPRRSPGEYFLAALGLALVAFVVAVLASPGSCRLNVGPDGGARPTPTAPAGR